jgi:hypothetical protein
MNPNKSSFDKLKRMEDYEDSLWRVIMLNYAEYEGRQLFEENEILKKDPGNKPSENELKRFDKLITGTFRKRRILDIVKISKNIMPKIGIFFLIFMLGFAAMFTTVSAFRVQVLNFLLTFEKEYTSVKLSGSEIAGDINNGFTNTYAPMYIPDGYYIDNFSNIGNLKTIEYINDEKNLIQFIEFSAGSSNIDTENAESSKTVKINGEDGFFVVKDGKITISWSADDRVFVIFAQLSEDEIVQIAESVIFVK